MTFWKSEIKKSSRKQHSRINDFLCDTLYYYCADNPPQRNLELSCLNQKLSDNIEHDTKLQKKKTFFSKIYSFINDEIEKYERPDSFLSFLRSEYSEKDSVSIGTNFKYDSYFMPAIPVYNISAIQKYNSEISDSTHKITISEISSTLNLKSDFVEDPSTFFLKEKSPTILTKSLAINSSSSSEDSNTSDIEKVKSIKKKYTTLYKKEPWITKRLYDFLIRKLEKKYNIYSVKYAEKFLIYLSSILKAMRSDEDANLQMYTDMIRHYMAKHHIIVNNFDYFEFITDYIPKPFSSKLLPTWDLTISPVLFDPRKVYDPIMEDDEFLNQFY